MTIQEAIDGVCEKEPLFTAMVKRLVPVKDNYGCPTLGTDGEHLYYNEHYLETLTDKEACAVVLHEVLHCAFRHQWRRGDRDQWKWNIATDYAINTVVNESFPLPKGCLLDTKYHGMSADEIYDSLPDEKMSGQEWCDKTHWDDKEGEGKPAPGPTNPLQDAWEKMTGKKVKKSSKTAKELEKMWKQMFDKHILKQYGKMPDSIKRVIEKDYYVPVIDWSSLIQSLLSEDVNDYTFAQPDRRFLEAEYILPAQFSMDKLQDVVFVFDTSGSISDEDLHAYHGECLNLFSHFSNLSGWVAVCDAYLHSFTEINPKQKAADFQFVGRGGTDFRPVFDELTRRQMKPKAVFYFTDTYGAFPDETPEYPVFWMVRSEVGDNEQYEVPFGQIIKFLS